MNIQRLNSTGTFTRINGDYFSYNTRLSFSYKTEYFINRTRYSNTTSKHQHYLPYADFNHTLYHQNYGDYAEKQAIQFEINGLQQELETIQNKRKTINSCLVINKINKKIEFLSNLIKEA